MDLKLVPNLAIMDLLQTVKEASSKIIQDRNQKLTGLNHILSARGVMSAVILVKAKVQKIKNL
jgi:hypothetical protein